MSLESISGSKPGLLDPSQSQRLLKNPDSTLTFASFDPYTASVRLSGSHKNNHNEELCRPKRIVIENTPSGESTWRFVPNATWQSGVLNEGTWPRLVEICGAQILVSQDQWEIYKLDPEYECLVRTPPLLTSITRAKPPSPLKFPALPATPTKSNSTFSHLHKRRLSDSPDLRSAFRNSYFLQPGVPLNKRQRQRSLPVDFDDDSSELDDEDEEEVEAMVVDAMKNKLHLKSERLRKVHANIAEARSRRREWNAQWKKRNEPQDEDTFMNPESPPKFKNPESPPKFKNASRSPQRTKSYYRRKVPMMQDTTTDDSQETSKTSSRVDEDTIDDEVIFSKRTRTSSPESSQPTVAPGKRTDRGRKRKEELDRRFRERAEAKRRIFEDEILADITEGRTGNGVPNGATTESSAQEEDEAAYQARIEESRRKIAELDVDNNPFQEGSSRRQERAQESDQRRTTETKSSYSSSSQNGVPKPGPSRTQFSSSGTEARRRAEEAEESKNKLEDLVRRREHALNQVRLDKLTCSKGAWTAHRALGHFRSLSERFDKAEFHRGDVLLFELVPWPVLRRPGSFGVEDVDWSAVETFFAQIRNYLSLEEYRGLVDKSHKRFHPDRWRSRKVLNNVEDEEEKECLEVAANTVAQALTPLWKAVTGRR